MDEFRPDRFEETKVHLKNKEPEHEASIPEMMEKENKRSVMATIFASLSFLIGASGVIAVVHEQNLNREHDQFIYLLKLELDDLKAERDRRVAVRDDFIKSAVGLRTIRDEELDACKRGLRNTEEAKHQFVVKRLKARENIVNVLTNIKFTFKDIPDDLKKSMGDLATFDVNVTDVCAPSSPNEIEWKKIEITNINLLDKSVKNLDLLISEKKNKLENHK